MSVMTMHLNSESRISMRTENNSPKSVENGALHQQIPAISFDSFLTLSQAVQSLPKINGRHLTSATLWRWCRKGINGIILEHRCIGRAIVTSEAALYKFFDELAKAQRPLTTGRNITNNCQDCNQAHQQLTDLR